MADVKRRVVDAGLVKAVWIALLPGGLLFAILQTYGYWRTGTFGIDSHAYWVAARDPASWYTGVPGQTDAYLYSPVFAQVIAPLGKLPWPAFQLVWAALGVGAMVWLLQPLGVWRGLAIGLFLIQDILIGNIFSFMALSLVLSVRGASGSLALPALSKVAPAVVGLWHVVRGEWRSVVWMVGVIGGLVAASVVADPSAWQRWVSFLQESAGGNDVGALVRLGIALVLVIYAARRNIAWLLAPAMLLACPVLNGYAVLAVLAAIPRLGRGSGAVGTGTAAEVDVEADRASTGPTG